MQNKDDSRAKDDENPDLQSGDETVLPDDDATILSDDSDEENDSDETVLADDDSTVLADDETVIHDDNDSTILVDDDSTVIEDDDDSTVLVEDEEISVEGSGKAPSVDENGPSIDEKETPVLEEPQTLPSEAVQSSKGNQPPASEQASPPQPEEDRVPHIEGVEIEHFLGVGAAGSVYLARQRMLARRCALKVLHESLGKKAGFRRGFHREGQFLAQMDHPNIVRVYDVGERQGLYYLLLEYVDSGDLLEYMQMAGGILEPEEAKKIFTEILDALRYAHGKQIVHCDLKPQNILRTIDGRIKISDFGIAKVLGDIKPGKPKGSSGKIKVEGTPDYMSPELKSGKSKPSIKSDLYAVGVMMYYLLTGEKPKGDYKPASKVRKAIHPKWDVLIGQCLEPNPANRISTARKALTQLSEIPTEKQRINWPLFGAIGFAVVLGVASFLYFSNPPVDPSKDDNPIKKTDPSDGETVKKEDKNESGEDISQKDDSLAGPGTNQSQEKSESDQQNGENLENSDKTTGEKQTVEVINSEPEVPIEEVLSLALPNQRVNLALAIHKEQVVVKREVFLSNEAFGWQFRADVDAHFILLAYIEDQVHLVFPQPRGNPGMLVKGDMITSPSVEPKPPFGIEETVQIVASSDPAIVERLISVFGVKNVVSSQVFRQTIGLTENEWKEEAANKQIYTGSRKIKLKIIDAFHQQTEN